ncbi:MAG: hypothetical protein AAFZ07_25040, partial [Actinomycetota bacterium]
MAGTPERGDERLRARARAGSSSRRGELHRVQTLQATAGNRAVARAVAAAEPIGIQRNGPEPTDD